MDTTSTHTTINSLSRQYRINASKFQKLSDRVLLALGLNDYDLSVQFVDPTAIRKLNRTYRRKDKSTDVLAFPQNSWPKPLTAKSTTRVKKPAKFRRPLGDVVISLRNAEKNAKAIGHSLDREVAFLLIHGILHLCGHDHHEADEEKRMLREQKKLLRLLEVSN